MEKTETYLLDPAQPILVDLAMGRRGRAVLTGSRPFAIGASRFAAGIAHDMHADPSFKGREVAVRALGDSAGTLALTFA